MNIISQITTIVNTNRVPASEKWEKHKTDADRIGKKMMRSGLKERGCNVLACGNTIQYTYCAECGVYTVTKASLCHDRLCPICTWRRAIQRCNTLKTAMDYLMTEANNDHYFFLTLTVPNCIPSDLSETVKSMSASWAKLRRRVCFSKITGWARSLEITYNNRTHTMHPHYHVILDTDKDLTISDTWDIIKAWCALTHGAKAEAQNISEILPSEADTAECNTFIKKILEAFKYTQKTSDLDTMPVSEFRIYADQIAGARAVAYGGKIKIAIADLGLKEEDDNDEPTEIKICTNCKSDRLIKYIARWSMTDSQYHIIDTL